jgi:hypothetical protein
MIVVYFSATIEVEYNLLHKYHFSIDLVQNECLSIEFRSKRGFNKLLTIQKLYKMFSFTLID